MAVTSEAVCTAAARACRSAAGCVAEPEELDEQEEGEVVRTGGKQAIYEALSDPSAVHSKRIGDGARAARKRRKQLAEQALAAPTEPPAGDTATVAMQSSVASGSNTTPAAGKKNRKGKAERKRDKQRAEAAQAARQGTENGG